jgi:hypothetical protein
MARTWLGSPHGAESSVGGPSALDLSVGAFSWVVGRFRRRWVGFRGCWAVLVDPWAFSGVFAAGGWFVVAFDVVVAVVGQRMEGSDPRLTWRTVGGFASCSK